MFDDFDNGNNNETININEFKNLVNQIIANRPYTSIEDFQQKLQTILSGQY